MRLKIENFADVKEADLQIDGITVIAGENDTGKSTVGKILFSMFNSLGSIEDRVKTQRVSVLREKTWEILRSELYSGHCGKTEDVYEIMQKAWELADKVYEQVPRYSDMRQDEVRMIVEDALKTLFGKSRERMFGERFLEGIGQNVLLAANIPAELIVNQVLSRYFQRVFHHQINSLTPNCPPASVELWAEEGMARLGFEKDQCASFQQTFPVKNKALYIGNPHVANMLNDMRDGEETDEFLADVLMKEGADHFGKKTKKWEAGQEEMAEIQRILSEIVKGQIVKNADDEFCLLKNEAAEPVNFANLAISVKSFLILRMLLENECIQKDDVLIFDEPGTYLDARWQETYAHLIVLIQKCLGNPALVISHNEKFLRALVGYTEQYQLADQCRYYKTYDDGNKVRFKVGKVTGSLEQLYH